MIRNFIQFLPDIDNIIHPTVRGGELVFKTAKDKESVVDPLIKQV